MAVLLGLSLIVFMAYLYAGLQLHYLRRKSRLSSMINRAVDETGDIMMVISSEGRIIKISDGVLRLTGYNGEDLIDKPLEILIENKDVIYNASNNLSSEVSALNFDDINISLSDGGSLPVSISCVPVMEGKDRGAAALVIFGHDISRIKKLQDEVSEHKNTEQGLRESLDYFKTLFYRHNLVMLLIDRENLLILDANNAALKFYGLKSKDIGRIRITELSGLSEDEVRDFIQKSEQSKGSFSYYRHSFYNGEMRDIEVNFTPASLQGRNIVLATVNDVTERSKVDEYASYLTYHDSLTGLPNRYYFYKRLDQEIKEVNLRGGNFAVFYIDLEEFKYVNEHYGHDVGDILLCEIAKRIQKCVKGDCAARIGGDEFTLLIPDAPDFDSAKAVAGRILDELNKPIVAEGHPLSINANIGISIYPQNGEIVKMLIRNAEGNIYEDGK